MERRYNAETASQALIAEHVERMLVDGYVSRVSKGKWSGNVHVVLSDDIVLFGELEAMNKVEGWSISSVLRHMDTLKLIFERDR